MKGPNDPTCREIIHARSIWACYVVAGAAAVLHTHTAFRPVLSWKYQNPTNPGRYVPTITPLSVGQR